MDTLDLTINNSISKVAILDANGKAPVITLPGINIKHETVSRVATTRYYNNTGFVMSVYALFMYHSNSAASAIRVGNKGSDATNYSVFETMASNTTHSQPVTAMVPVGGWYSLNPSSGHNLVRVIETTYFHE